MNKGSLLLSTLFGVLYASASATGDSTLAASKTPRFIVSFSVGGGFKGGVMGAGLSYLHENDWGLAYQFVANLYPANQPTDYIPPRGLFGNYDEEQVNVNFIHAILFSKRIPAKQSSWIYTLSAGPTLTFQQHYNYIAIEPDYGWFSHSGNYELELKRRITAGLMLQAATGYRFNRLFTLGLSMMANISSQKSYAGIQVDFLRPITGKTLPRRGNKTYLFEQH